MKDFRLSVLACAIALVVIFLVFFIFGIRKAYADVPEGAEQYRRAIVSESGARFGLDAPVARLAAQIHQESAWRPQAESPFAQGMAQFTPATAGWIAEKFPDELWPADVWNPRWSIRAMVIYDAWLLERAQPRAATDCAAWAFTLAGYNGGESWVRRDRRLARNYCQSPRLWFDSVEHYTNRADWARRENRHYVRRILLDLEPVYLAAGWPGRGVCG